MSLKRNSMFNLAGMVLPLFLSLATVPAYISLIGLDRYGVLAIAWLFLGYFGMFDLGLGRATTFRIAELRDGPAEKRREAYHTALAINIFIGLLGGAIVTFSSALFFKYGIKIDATLQRELGLTALLLGLCLPVSTLSGVLTGALQGRERFALTNMIGVMSTGLFQLVPLVIAWLWTSNLSILILAGLATRVLTLLVFGIACQQEFGWSGRFEIAREQIKPLLSFGGWVTVSAMIAPLLTIVDRFLIGSVLGATAIAQYSVPYQIAQRLVIIPTSITAALFPRLSAEQDASSNDANLRLAKICILATTVAPVLVMIILTKSALTLWLGADFASKATLAAQLLLIAFWFNSLALLSFTILQAAGKPKIVAQILAIEVIPYLIVLYFGLKLYGLAGAAGAFVFRCAFDYVLLSYFAGSKFIPVRGVLTGAALLFGALIFAEAITPWTRSWYLMSVSLIVISCAEARRIIPVEYRSASTFKALFSCL